MKRAHAWLLGAVAADVAVLALGWVAVVAPARSDAATLRASTTAQQAANDKQRADLVRLRQQAAQLPATRREIAQIARQIPAGVELPAMIRQLTAVGRGTSVNVTSIAPGTPAAVAAGVTPLQQVPVQIAVSGSYPNVERYFGRLEALPRAVLVTSLTLQTANGSTSGAVTAQIGLRIFTTAAATTPTASTPAGAAR